MSLPIGFRCSQRGLQDYVDCPRRFQLRYLNNQPWPGLVVEPATEFEKQVQRGSKFHRLAQQHILGVDSSLLRHTIQDPVLATWWQTLVDSPPPDLPLAVRRAEFVMITSLSDWQLVGKFDMLAADLENRLVIVDWKTSQRHPSRMQLAKSLQTRVYQYLATRAGSSFFGGDQPRPEQIEMIYWYAETGSIERFDYDAARFSEDHNYLESLVSEIDQRGDDRWPMTHELSRCRTCQYRSLCSRSIGPGTMDDLQPDFAIDQFRLDFDQIPEIEF